jgi:hypothetical protein
MFLKRLKSLAAKLANLDLNHINTLRGKRKTLALNLRGRHDERS